MHLTHDPNTTGQQTWIVIPYGPDHRREMEALIGVEFDPAAGKYGTDWNKLRAYGLPAARGYGYNGIYLEVFELPDKRILIKRDDKYGCTSKLRFFANREEYAAWCRSLPQEIDQETGRPFRTEG